MSRGYGRIERVILARLAEEPDNAFTVEDLALAIYGGVAKKHRVAILRAIRSLRRSRPDLGFYTGWGRQGAVYNLASVTSHGMARLKNDWASHYLAWKSEADLRRELEAGGRYHDCIVEGGHWWRHWQMELVKRAGDTARLADLKAEQDRAIADLPRGPVPASDSFR